MKIFVIYILVTLSVIDGISVNIPDGKKATKVIGSKLAYYYPPFSNFETTYEGRNYYKRYLGDDCSGFAQGVIYILSNGDRGQTGDVNTATDGLHNHNVAASMLVSDRVVDEAMLNLGWEKYYLDTDNKWYRKRKYGGQIETKKVVDITGYKMSELDVNFLEPGDLLCTKENSKDGHVEFYIGYNYNLIYNGIEDINGSINRDIEYGIESIITDNKAQQGHVTFGWGGVHNTFLIETNYFTYTNTGFKRHCEDVDNRNYTVIWRKN